MQDLSLLKSSSFSVVRTVVCTSPPLSLGGPTSTTCPRSYDCTYPFEVGEVTHVFSTTKCNPLSRSQVVGYPTVLTEDRTGYVTLVLLNLTSFDRPDPVGLSTVVASLYPFTEVKWYSSGDPR